MSDPMFVVQQIAADASTLDDFSKGLHEATVALNAAEAAWEEAYDKVMADLEDEYAQAGRKSVPEHTAVSAARRAHRDLWVTYRNAKRRVDKQQKQLSAKIAALSGRQSELKALTDEARNQHFAAQQRDVGQTFGRRAA
jgi:hypothetical protein